MTPLDRRVALKIGLHRAKAGDPVLSVGKPGTNLKRIVRRKPKAKKPPPKD